MCFIDFPLLVLKEMYSYWLKQMEEKALLRFYLFVVLKQRPDELLGVLGQGHM